MDWLPFALLAGAADIGYNLLTRVSLKGKEKALEYSWAFGVVRTVIFLVWVIFDFNLLLSPGNILLLLAIGSLNILTIYLLMQMHSINELSVSTVIGTLRMIWVPIIAFLLLGEILKPSEYLGILTLFSGVIFVASPSKLVKDKAARTALLFSLSVALVSVLIKSAVNNNSVATIVLFMSFPIALIYPLIAKNKLRLIKSIRHDFVKKAGITLFSVVALYSYTKALSLGEVGKVNAIFQAMAILTVFSGIVFLKERRKITYKIVGIILAVVGSIIII